MDVLFILTMRYFNKTKVRSAPQTNLKFELKILKHQCQISQEIDNFW